MGTVYCGPYADAIGYGRHEGYADRLMPNGEFSNGEWSARYPADAHVAFVAACSCGWRSSEQHAPTDSGEDQACDEWDRDHLQPLINAEARKHTVPADVLLTFIWSLRTSAPHATNGEGEAVTTEYGIGLLDTADRLEHLLDGLAVAKSHRSAEGGEQQ